MVRFYKKSFEPWRKKLNKKKPVELSVLVDDYATSQLGDLP